MKLRFLGKNSTPDESPTLYATDQDSYVVQGWMVTDADILARLPVPDDETIVEVPAALLDHLAADGLDGEVTNVAPPIVGVTSGGNYIIQGKQVTDAEALSQMSNPRPRDLRTCHHAGCGQTAAWRVRTWSQSQQRSETSSSRRFGARPCIWRCATCTPRTSRKTDSQPGYAANRWTPRPKLNGGGLGFELMKRNNEAGKTLRRLRIVSEPVTDYIRFEWLDAAQLVRAGEDVRWLPRRKASTLLLPGNDFWMFDREILAFTHFSGDGHVLDREVTTNPDIVEACAAAFEKAWEIAIPHNEYTPS